MGNSTMEQFGGIVRINLHFLCLNVVPFCKDKKYPEQGHDKWKSNGATHSRTEGREYQAAIKDL